ncbi:hypothetical protein C8R48DRAFT_777553 [Suillus tomentosus]|nr:hypothetical protein C8R48DRAFT_777553 [Suillus tomentosus]
MGHRTTHEVIQCFFHDRDPLDDIEPNSGGTGNDDDEIEESGIGSSTTQATTDSVLEPENDELEYNNYGYSGIEQREEGEEEEEEEEEDGDENGDEADEKENINRDDDAIVDDELGMEDGENNDKELDGFDEF